MSCAQIRRPWRALLRLTVSSGVYRVTLESDSLSLVQELNSGDSDMAELGSCIARLEAIVSSSLIGMSLCCNSVAHSLAQFGCHAAMPSTIWMEHMPDFVSGLDSPVFSFLFYSIWIHQLVNEKSFST